ncbi:IS1096 element passenger TnpR family protein [Paraburkholderia sp. NPDC080076]|uniref:IS1096 element passenger TnpR family protein n=1 Tax=Paraburkholderia sp. NPDC080076 TaxID=3390605 RepID=UPI003D05868F
MTLTTIGNIASKSKYLAAGSGLTLANLLGRPRRMSAEDVGGGPGYIEFLEALTDWSREDHEQLLESCGGGFDPDAFDLAAVNERLSDEF